MPVGDGDGSPAPVGVVGGIDLRNSDAKELKKIAADNSSTLDQADPAVAAISNGAKNGEIQTTEAAITKKVSIFTSFFQFISNR